MVYRKAAAWWLVFVLLGVVPAAAAFKYVEVGQKAPGFDLEALDGKRVRLEDRLGAKALAVVFWATWSPRSRPLLDDLQKLYESRRDKGFEVIAINVDHEAIDAETRKNIEEMARGWEFTVLLDDGLSTYYAYGVVATPSLALLDGTGTIRFTRAGYSTAARLEIREAVDGLLGLSEEKARRVAVRKRDYVPPKKATLHFQKAQILIRRGMARKAVRDLERAVRLDPNWAAPRVLLARIYLEQSGRRPSRLAKAEKLLREARKIQPNHLQTLTLLAEVLVREEKYGEALEAAEQAVALEEGYTPAWLAKARSLRALGRHREASEAIDRAWELDPRNPYVLREKGELAAARQDWEEAAGWFRKAVEAAWRAAGAEG